MKDKEISFEILLYDITSKVVAYIIEIKKWDENTALEKFIQSNTYSLLEDEQTKIWQKSPLMIAQLFIDECLGNIEFFEV